VKQTKSKSKSYKETKSIYKWFIFKQFSSHSKCDQVKSHELSILLTGNYFYCGTLLNLCLGNQPSWFI